MDVENWKLFLQAVTTLAGAVGLIWTIVWAIRGPRLRLSVLDPRGQFTRYGDSQDAPPVHFYHLRVRNRRRWIANNVRVKLIAIDREGKEGGIGVQRAPAYFIWAAQPSPKPYLLDVLGLDEEACNLGYIMHKEGVFKLDVCDPARVGQQWDKWPPHFDGFLHARERMRIQLVALAENARSNVLGIEISWDGEWDDEAEEMQKHLVVREVRPGALASVRSRLGLGS
jgi:hypothetical protein